MNTNKTFYDSNIARVFLISFCDDNTKSLDVPQSFSLDESELKISLAAKLYEQGKMTLGQSAQLAGLSKRAFIEILGLYGVSVFSDSVDDLIKDINNA